MKAKPDLKPMSWVIRSRYGKKMATGSTSHEAIKCWLYSVTKINQRKLQKFPTNWPSWKQDGFTCHRETPEQP